MGSTLTAEEYIQHEYSAERRSEYINGQLFIMPAEKDTNNEVAGLLFMLLYQQLKAMGFTIYSHDVKIAIPNEHKYFYPDVFATREPKQPDNQYIKYAPEIIVEVVSPGSHSHDYIDKYIEYIKIPSLQYYLIVEPETILITMYSRGGDDWEVQKFTKLTDVIDLPAFSAKLVMQDVYEV